MKKIKKENPVPPKIQTTNELLEFLKADKKDAPPREKAVNYKMIPSKRPEFKKRLKKDIDNWTGWDFLGYYLQVYIDVIGEEDSNFKRQNSYQFSTERRLIIDCLKLHFNNDKVRFHEFIDFIIPWWRSDDSWIKGEDKFLPNYKGIFTTRSNAYYRAFIGAKNAPQKKISRQEADNKAASWENWIEED